MGRFEIRERRLALNQAIASVFIIMLASPGSAQTQPLFSENVAIEVGRELLQETGFHAMTTSAAVNTTAMAQAQMLGGVFSTLAKQMQEQEQSTPSVGGVNKTATSPAITNTTDLPPAINPSDTPVLYKLLTEVPVEDPESLRSAVVAALTMQQQAGQGAAPRVLDIINAQKLLERAAETIMAIRNLPLTLGTGTNLKLVLEKYRDLEALHAAVQALTSPQQRAALERLLTEAIRLYILFINTFIVAYYAYLSRVWYAWRDIGRVVRDSIAIAVSAINLAVFVRSTNLTTSARIIPSAGVGSGSGQPGGVAVVPGRRLSSALPSELPDLGTNPGLARAALSVSLSDLSPEQLEMVEIIAASGREAHKVIDWSRGNLDRLEGFMDELEMDYEADLAAVGKGAIGRFWEGVTPSTSDAELSENETLKKISHLLSRRLNAASANSSSASASLFGPDGLLRSGLGDGPLYDGAVLAMNKLWDVMPRLNFTSPEDVALTNLLRYAAAALLIVQQAINFIQSIVELVGDIYAVVPAILLLYTGPINFALSVRAYHVLVRNTLPELSAGAKQQWVGVLDRLAAQLQSFSLGTIRGQLAAQRAALTSTSNIVSSYMPLGRTGSSAAGTQAATRQQIASTAAASEAGAAGVAAGEGGTAIAAQGAARNPAAAGAAAAIAASTPSRG